jgi:dTDP-4-dehydrorhamnose 3,5-epimerase-like enzyme
MKFIPKLLKGATHHDKRGDLYYNDYFHKFSIKRVYFIKNQNTSIIRAWQGHKIEQRWFSAVTGSFKILLIKIDNWESPNQDLIPVEFILNSNKLDVLHIPSGYISSIQAIEGNSKLMVMANYFLGEINDEYKYLQTYFKKI